MVEYKRIKGGEKNELSGVPFNMEELELVCDLYVEVDGKGIHENNPKIHALANKLGRTVRSIENQLLGFRAVDTGNAGRQNFNILIPNIWNRRRSILTQNELEGEIKITKKKSVNLDEFKFRISSQLKNIIGKELITDDYVAVFELVKNSFDAYAKKINIIFGEKNIIIADDGKGMDKEDLIRKWLFVGYSAKKEGIEDERIKGEEYKSYRDKIQTKSNFAGAKGIGRFSTDRLGERMTLTTKTPSIKSLYWQISINWGDFESDAEEEFIDMEIKYESFIESPIPDFKNGTVIEISNLRSVWPREKKLNLKHSLEKLINPFQNVDKNDGKSSFNIRINSSEDILKDKEIKSVGNYSNREIVNGLVHNFIFETLDIKTTQIISYISEDQLTIITELIDRNNLIYKIVEQNNYQYLNPQSRIHLYYLNRSAKVNFSKLMKIPSVQFGSIFLFNNGFRVFPIGEPGDDPFRIDRRKGQGYARHLGTRELIGQVELWGNSEQFVESSSRNQGFIESSGTNELENYFLSILTRLEKYVAPILWKIKDRTGDEDELLDYNAKTHILELISKLAGNENIQLLEYSKELVSIIKDKTEDTPPEVFEYLEQIASKTEDGILKGEIIKTRELYIQLTRLKEEEERKRIESEERAKEEERKRKDAEEKAKEEERKRKEADYQRLKAEEEVRKERARRIAEEQHRRQRESQVRFLESVKSLDIEDVLIMHHQIGIDANTIDTTIHNFRKKLAKKKVLTIEDVDNLLCDIILINKKILAVSRFTTRENFMAAARVTTDDIISFIKSYIFDIYKYHFDDDVSIKTIDNLKKPFIIEFKPIEFTIIIDNLISNSKRQNAKNITFTFSVLDDNLAINYIDDGDGLDKSLKNPNIIFEKGITTTRGSGLGLYHVSNILTEMRNSTIKVNPLKKGIEFIIILNNN